MAVIDPRKSVRIPIPHEKDEWVEIRPVTIGDIEHAATVAKVNVSARLAILERVVTAWSYPQPVNAETLRQLDNRTFQWLDLESLKVSNIDDEETGEKKDVTGSDSHSSLTEAVVAAGSPANSSI